MLAGAISSNAQSLSGRVIEVSPGDTVPIPGANIYWMGTQTGTTTGPGGEFTIERTDATNKLITSYIGYQTDTMEVGSANRVAVVLKSSVELDQVEVAHRKKTTEIGYMDTKKVEKVGEEELEKAACCNLSESFETIPSVDASYSDAVTGTRQIKMLGLASPYTVISRENVPVIRGLASIYGLTYVPGTWIEGMQLIKGTGSVVNGFESIAGQINYELRKPEDSDRLYVNAYANQGGRLEANAHSAFDVSERWSSAVLLHGHMNQTKNDRNDDGFLDMPLKEMATAANRWKYKGPNGWRFQAGVKGTFVNSTGGQTRFDPDDPEGMDYWGMQLETRRIEGWAKIGKVNDVLSWRSSGLQVYGAYQEQDSRWGMRDFDSEWTTFYGNYIYQSVIGNTNHKFKTGASLQYDDYDELLDSTDYDRTEIVPGAYFEYTYAPREEFNVVLGLRGDYHNQYGAFATPRAHLRYAPRESTVFRISGGRGQRTANVIAENSGLLASAREFRILGDDSDKPFGLEPEVAWNYGFNVTQTFELGGRNGTVSLDAYRTDFENQIIVDLDQSPQQAVFYNLEGRSYSNSAQLQVDYELINRLDLRLAYRWHDVKATYDGDLRQQPFVAAHRGFANVAYKTPSGWKFDYTVSWQGPQRIPDTDSNPGQYQLDNESPDFVTMNAQVTKMLSDQFEVYAGAENILDYRQDNPIVASDEPYSEYFDSSMVWGPIFGRNMYVGLRYRVR